MSRAIVVLFLLGPLAFSANRAEEEIAALKVKLAVSEAARVATEKARADLAQQMFVQGSELRRQTIVADNARADQVTAEQAAASAERARVDAEHSRQNLALQLNHATAEASTARASEVNTTKLEASVDAVSKVVISRTTTGSAREKTAALAASNARDAADQASKAIEIAAASLAKTQSIDKKTAEVQKAVAHHWYQWDSTTIVAFLSFVTAVVTFRRVHVLTVNVNGRLSQLLTETGKASRAEGVIEGRDNPAPAPVEKSNPLL